MCVSLITVRNQSLESEKVVVDTGSFGKRRKMSRNGSPNSSMFDVTQLAAALDEETASSYSSCSSLASSASEQSSVPQSSTSYSSPEAAFAEAAFDFYDTFNEDAPSLPSLSFSDQNRGSLISSHILAKRGSLGKRSRGLYRSKTVTSNLCDLVSDENN